MPDPLHVMPEFGRKHEASPRCWCRPRVERKNPQTGEEHAAPLYIHKLEN